MPEYERRIRIGVLALQGGFSEHISHLKRAVEFLQDEIEHVNTTYQVLEVKSPGDLVSLEGLILPGGESGTMSFFLENYPELLEKLREFRRNNKPIFGTCAGMILLANEVECQKQNGQVMIGGMDIKVRRNYYGSQTQSFEGMLSLNQDDLLGTDCLPRPMLFIRAPAIVKINPDRVKILAKYKGSIVAVQQNNLMATSFHPELTEDIHWHIYFMRFVISHYKHCKY